jgi:hypothetical protein
MQVTGDGIGLVVRSTLRNEGVASFWKGIVWAWGREGSYASIKLGGYGPVRDAIGAGGKDGTYTHRIVHVHGIALCRAQQPQWHISNSHYRSLSSAPFYMKFLAGAITGGVGSVVGNPFDVLKTLAQANQGKSVGLTTLVSNMYSEQGINGFYRGLSANILRACVLNATKMGCYDISKGYVTDATGWARKDVRTSFTSATLAGFFMTCTVSPFDRIRTALMSQPPNAKLYNGFADCLVKIVSEHGVSSLWRGFIPIWARFAPTATIQLLTIEVLYEAAGLQAL